MKASTVRETPSGLKIDYVGVNIPDCQIRMLSAPCSQSKPSEYSACLAAMNEPPYLHAGFDAFLLIP